MRSKLLTLFLLCLNLLLWPENQAVVNSHIPRSAPDSILSMKQEERKAQMKKLFQSVPVDTAAQKVVMPQAHFRDKYQDPEFNYHQEEGGKSFLKRLFEKIGLLLEKLFGMGTLNKYSDLTGIIFKILCGLVVLVVLYFMIRLVMNHKGKWFFTKKNEDISIDLQNTEQLIQSADFEQLISQMEKMGDTRQSIRLHYLWLLKDLKENGLIIFLPEKTNADYLSQLKDERIRSKFSYLSYLYNCIWYGEFSIDDDEYRSAKNAFLIYLKGDRNNG